MTLVHCFRWFATQTHSSKVIIDFGRLQLKIVIRHIFKVDLFQ